MLLQQRTMDTRPADLRLGDPADSDLVTSESLEIGLPSESEPGIDLTGDQADVLTGCSQTHLAAVPDEPPALFLPACGALCDVFWWARR
jgi:hypothetical protein